MPLHPLPPWFTETVHHLINTPLAHYAAQLLWQRGIRDRDQLAGFLDPNCYTPTSPFAFGAEMTAAVDRLQQAHQQGEKVAIWGDFDADGITATAVLWEGLGQFFQPEAQLIYYIPHRFTESHGLSIAGLDHLAEWGCQVIVTCDTGSTNLTEIRYAAERGMDVIVTDHHTLAVERPPVTAIVNPRLLPIDHPLACLSGVAVAYKLVEALYQTFPPTPSQQPIERLLDLVAIGLIADLVELKGDCRYLAQRGIEQLQQNQYAETAPRPGIARLLELCKRSGDRPTDISFGLGPRINAISRIHGDARFCVELLTSPDPQHCRDLAEATELANTRRKALQKDLVQQVRSRLAQIDLSTTPVIVLADPQWSIGILGLVAGQIAQDYGRPTVLLSTEAAIEDRPTLARGSARSIAGIDLYRLFEQQAHLITRFGGHPLAAGLCLPVENIPLLTEALNQQVRQMGGFIGGFETSFQADLCLTIADLNQEGGKALFRSLKWLEPYGMGNPTPRLLLQNVWFEHVRNRNIQDWRGRTVRYIKTEFDLWDDTTDQGFPGIWWEHYRDEIPNHRCDAIVELDFNTYQKRYEVRLIALRPTIADATLTPAPAIDWLLDWRTTPPAEPPANTLRLTHCPTSWDELQTWFQRAITSQRQLAIAYSPLVEQTPTETWHTLVGIAKYLSRTEQAVPLTQLQDKLNLSERTLAVGLQTLEQVGFAIRVVAGRLKVTLDRPIEDLAIAIPGSETDSEPSSEIFWATDHTSNSEFSAYDQIDDQTYDQTNDQTNDQKSVMAIDRFLQAVQEEQFRRQYFHTVPLSVMQSAIRLSYR